MPETLPDGYRPADRARWVPEPAKSRRRTAFGRDRARVLHSSALRRLAAKTQVVQPGASDFPRTRLTHTLEVAQIGRELGQELGSDPDLVETACLAHDLGHPPFGHNGEAALDAIARPCGGFEGNAQTLRLLTRLEGKVFTAEGASAGLNLTRAALDAAVKYPWPRRAGAPGEPSGKFGHYADDAEVFAWVRQGAPGRRTCFEAQVMDWADDVAYSVHDLEDGLQTGHIKLGALRDPGERREVCERAAADYTDADPAELAEVFERLLAEPFWPREYTGDIRSLAALKNLTSELIGRFCQGAEDATRAAHGAGALRRYDAELRVPRRRLLECAVLKAVAAHYVMTRAGAREQQARERELVEELVHLIRVGAPRTLDAAFAPAYLAAADDGAALRVVVDQVASLTDTSALAWHRRLSGG
ncbi:deoxyguanosinetriphosphate triphosphohydrolase [Allonocardiopsis opalescens]|uniref:Deoxyguanosinetriphosphate triphosphohydrolase-like protein n=1 Tax=Allonocardiopsis opalescens TaxID=1144618 RepID=A0A2T0QFR0_9ACTN|nr:deoxyguanosinetriphosphate triphosphohydrolase [Allonocardiopsis opalescens]PRY02720.1 dGTPase [Allonocardiopsis opalescens]